jgi:hypothetical protein
MNFNRGSDPKSSMGIGRGKYSKKEFPGYRYRASVRITYRVNMESHNAMIDVYTDQKDQKKVMDELMRRAKDNVEYMIIENWSSALQDKLAEAFIEETLKGL